MSFVLNAKERKREAKDRASKKKFQYASVRKQEREKSKNETSFLFAFFDKKNRQTNKNQTKLAAGGGSHCVACVAVLKKYALPSDV